MHVAMRDVYMNPTVRRLARAIDAVTPLEAAEPEFAPAHPPSNLAYYGCGGAQTAFYLSYRRARLRTGATEHRMDLRRRRLAACALCARPRRRRGAVFGLEALAVAAKWLLIGRARAQVLPIWGLAYFRYWALQLTLQFGHFHDVVTHRKAIQPETAAANIRQGLNALVRIRLLQRSNDGGGLLFAVCFGEACVPLFLSGQS